MYNANPVVTTFSSYFNNDNAKMKELISIAPVAAAIYSNDAFQAYSTGVFTGCPSNAESRTKVNHAVIIVGYDSNGNYIIKNSWATTWGQNGYGVVSKDADCGLSAYVYQFNSAAPPGNGVLYYNQINLNGIFLS